VIYQIQRKTWGARRVQKESSLMTRPLGKFALTVKSARETYTWKIFLLYKRYIIYLRLRIYYIGCAFVLGLSAKYTRTALLKSRWWDRGKWVKKEGYTHIYVCPSLSGSEQKRRNTKWVFLLYPSTHLLVCCLSRANHVETILPLTFPTLPLNQCDNLTCLSSGFYYVQKYI